MLTVDQLTPEQCAALLVWNRAIASITQRELNGALTASDAAAMRHDVQAAAEHELAPHIFVPRIVL